MEKKRFTHMLLVKNVNLGVRLVCIEFERKDSIIIFTAPHRNHIDGQRYIIAFCF